MFLLDTNVVSELRKIHINKADVGVAKWASRVSAGSLYMSVITILELEISILQIQRKDPDQGRIFREWLDTNILPEFHDRILPIDTAIVQRCASLHVPDPYAERDALIAATAIVYGMKVVTRNVQDFFSTGVGLLNPWETPE